MICLYETHELYNRIVLIHCLDPCFFHTSVIMFEMHNFAYRILYIVFFFFYNDSVFLITHVSVSNFVQLIIYSIYVFRFFRCSFLILSNRFAFYYTFVYVCVLYKMATGSRIQIIYQSYDAVVCSNIIMFVVRNKVVTEIRHTGQNTPV